MATLPTTPPSVTAWPTSPSRARPATFATEADAFLGHFPVGQADQQNLVNWLNSTAGQSYTNALEAAASATNSAASAQLAQDALDSAISATNYKGAWSSLSGALNIPASVSHNNGLWLLTANLANVAASEPSEANSNWFLVFRKATDLDVENGTQYANPDAKQLKGFVQRNWSSLTTAKTYGDSCFYNGKEYVVRNPLTDPTIAPPTTAGRSYFKTDGVDDYINTSIQCTNGDVLKAKFTAPLSKATQTLFAGILFELDVDGTYSFGSGYTVKVDGASVTSSSAYPLDGLEHEIEITITSTITLTRIFASSTPANYSKLSVYDLEQIRSGTRIHYYPLRTDAINYLAGNLIKDEQCTNSESWTKGAGWKVEDNKLKGSSGAQSIISIPLTTPISIGETVRIVYDATITSGSLTVVNSGLAANTSSGKYDKVAVYDVAESILQIQKSSDFVGDVSNVKVIKLNELSPSASFTSSSGFFFEGDAVITGGQAVFGSSAGLKSVSFMVNLVAGKKYRFVYKTNGRTVGSLRAQANTESQMTPQAFQSTDGYHEYIGTALMSTTEARFFVLTIDGWDGNVEYFSVTEVTDGTENGSPIKTFDKHWQLTSGEQFLPSSAGLVKFGDNLAIDSNNTLEIEPLANGSRGDTIKLARKEGFTPIIKLSATDISAGKLIRYGVQTDTQLTLDTDKVATLIHNGTDIEVKI